MVHKKKCSPGEARTHNPGIAHELLSYKYRALTNCATGAIENKGTETGLFRRGINIIGNTCCF